MRKYSVWLGLLAIAGLCATSAHAQKIDINIANISARQGIGPGGGIPGTAADATAPTGTQITDIQPVSWFEYVINVDTPGLYTVSVNWEMPGADPDVVFSFETRPVSTDPYITHYTTPDSAVLPRQATWTGLQVINDPSGKPLTVPLQAGQNVFRLQNVARRHIPITGGGGYADPFVEGQVPGSPPTGQTPIRAVDGLSLWSDLRVGAIQLNRTADLPAMGSITGTVTGTMPAGFTPATVPVTQAWITANPTGTSQVELTSWWKWGYWTRSKSDGSFTLQAPQGAQDVMAGRPDSYRLPGSAVVPVTVPATGAATANLTLLSIFAPDPNNSNTLTAYVQSEYFQTMVGQNGLLEVPEGENGFKMGWIDPPDATSMLVDVPVAGYYQVTSTYTNGGALGTARVSSDIGTSTQGDQQPNGWGTHSTSQYPDPIYLVQGPQMITQTLLAGNSDQDGFELRYQPDIPATFGVVNGTVTDAATGKPIPGATIQVGSATVTTAPANGYLLPGTYRMVLQPGSNLKMTVTAPYQYAPQTRIISVTANTTATQDFQIALRPNTELSTANGYNWKLIPNTGGSADFSAVAAPETDAVPITVPSNWDGLTYTPSGGTTAITNSQDEVYGWYRLHFTLPADMAAALQAYPSRMLALKYLADDVDAAYVNGTLIGQTGGFPNPPLAKQPDTYTNPNVAPWTQTYMPPGVTDAYGVPRVYYIPSSLLNLTGDNVLAVKVYDDVLGGGISTAPTLEVALGTGVISGTITASGTPVAGMRVAAMDPSGLVSDWTLTDASGNFMLGHVLAGPTVLGAAKPGYNAITKTGLNGSATGLALTTTATTGGPAPSYDEFADPGNTGTEWQGKFDAISEINSTYPPTVNQPGLDVSGSGATIPADTVTVTPAGAERAGILTKARFNKFASVNAARLVSAVPGTPDPFTADPTTSNPVGGLPNVIMQINANPATDVNQVGFSQYVELDVEGYVKVADGSNGGAGSIHPRYMIWIEGMGNPIVGYVPVPNIQTMKDVTPTNPLDMEIVRLGSFYDFYFNGTLVAGLNAPTTAGFGNHKIFLYDYYTTTTPPGVTGLTWDWVKAGPLALTPPSKGDLNANGVLDMGDAVRALQLASGLDVASSADQSTGNVTGDSGISILDAVALAQQASAQ